jgi:hypothetical protein
MQVQHILLIFLIVIIGFWLVNSFYYANEKREAEYRRKRAAEKKE